MTADWIAYLSPAALILYIVIREILMPLIKLLLAKLDCKNLILSPASVATDCLIFHSDSRTKLDLIMRELSHISEQQRGNWEAQWTERGKIADQLKDVAMDLRTLVIAQELGIPRQLRRRGGDAA